MKDAVEARRARIAISDPKLFRTGAVLVLHAWSLSRIVPVLAAALAVSLLGLSPWTFLLPLLAIAGTAYFLPLGGNAYITRQVRALRPADAKEEDGFVVQLTCWPRMRSGLRALLEDADDFGYLRFSGSELEFYGDAVKLVLPYERIREIRRRNIGFRGLYVYGTRIEVIADGLPNASILSFAERSSWLLPASRRTAKRLLERLSTAQRRA